MGASVESEKLTEEHEADREPTRTSRRVFWLRMFAFFIVPAMFLGVLAVRLVRTQPRELEGKTAPHFELPLLGSNETLSSEELRGSPVIVNFWASWCIPCREEAPLLEKKWRKYKEQGVRFLGVNVQDSEQDALDFVREFGITFPSVRDVEQELWTEFGVRGLPETFFVDHEYRFVSVGSQGQIGTSGATKILGAIPPPVLESQIRLLLERKRT